MPGADQGQRDGLSGRGGVLQGQQRHRQRRQRGERPPQHQVGIVCEKEWNHKILTLALHWRLHF